MSVFGRIVKLTKKSTLLWHNGKCRILPFVSRHKIGDIIDENDRLLCKCRGSCNVNELIKAYKIKQRRFFYISEIKEFLKRRGFREIITPKLKNGIAFEPNIDLIHTPSGYLAPSPELEIKKLLSLGFDRVFELNWAYRDDPETPLHNREFLMLEWYIAMETPQNTIKLLIDMIRHLNGDSNILEFHDYTVDLSTIEYISYGDLFQKQCRINIHNPEELKKQKRLLSIEGNLAKEELLDAIFASRIEKSLGLEHPVVVYNFPKKRAALARVENGHAKRFELYIGGTELANCYEEETEWDSLSSRIEITDKGFINSMKTGFAPSSGIAVGVDRLIMMLLNLNNINF